MKATHKLVSIEELEKVISEVKHLGSMATVTNMNLVLDYSPEVDLSEEGIREKAIEQWDNDVAKINGYLQCAQDLLAIPHVAKSCVKNPWS